MRALYRRFVCFCLLQLVLRVALSYGQNSIPSEFPCVPDSEVEAIACTASTLYVGGNFTSIGPYTGSFVPLDSVSARPLKNFPKVKGPVRACLPDSQGGWYIGGSFKIIGNLRRNGIAHILSSGAVDPAWDPNIDGAVHAMAIAGSRLYVGGLFWSVGGKSHNNLAILNIATGSLISSSPDADSLVRAFAIAKDVVYVGGDFGKIGGAERRRIAAINIAAGAVTAWNPIVWEYPEITISWPPEQYRLPSFVTSLILSGSTLYVSGDFPGIGGATRDCLAALDAATGEAKPWNPSQNVADIMCMALKGSTLYVGGNLGTIGGRECKSIAALDVATGNARDWNPDLGTIYQVHSMAIIDSMLYVGKTSTNGSLYFAKNALAFDLFTGKAAAWAPETNGAVYSINATRSGIWVGGSFCSTGRTSRNHIAAFDRTTGVLKDWNPNINGPVYALAVHESSVFAGGKFSQVGSKSCESLAAIDAVSGLPSKWNPVTNLYAAYALALSDSTIFAGGWGGVTGFKIPPNLFSDNLATQSLPYWSINPNDRIYSLALTSSTLYLGGSFTSVDARPRNRIAAFDIATAKVTDWNPNSSGNIYDLAIGKQKVYAGGVFSKMGDGICTSVVALDSASGRATDWNPGSAGFQNTSYIPWVFLMIGGGSDVRPKIYTFSLSDSLVYVGGYFSQLAGEPCFFLGALEARTGKKLPWDPRPNSWVNDVVVSGSDVFAAGSFTYVGDEMRPYVAWFKIIPTHSDTWSFYH